MLNTTPGYLAAQAPAQSPGSGTLYSTVSGNNGSEVKSVLRLTTEGSSAQYGVYPALQQHLWKGPGAWVTQPNGSFEYVYGETRVTFSLKVVSFSGGTCSGLVTVEQWIAGTVTLLGSKTVGCRDGVEMRSVVTGSSKALTYLDGALILGPLNVTQTMTAGMGIGLSWCPPENGIRRVDLGYADTGAPNRVSSSGLVVDAQPTSVSLSWTGASDNSGGSGAARYVVHRNGVYLGEVRNSPFTDGTTVAGTTYTYSIYTVDFHNNWSTARDVSVTTPAVAVLDSQRRGVRSTGSYWGAMGENINVMSGNLNFSAPLVAAAGRGGWKVPLGLSYNSQFWRKDNNGTFQSGRDIGYGHGWLLTPGKVVPYYSSGFTIHHYTFTDPSGAEYVLDVNEGGYWRSREATYVRYQASAQKLWFPDGTFWLFYGLSGGAEPDAGTMYPTQIQDRNGNQVVIEYMQGNQAAAGSTSGRMARVSDVRAAANWGTVFQFDYTAETVPHLLRITNVVTPAEKYEFSYSAAVTLTSPFAPNGTFGTTVKLERITHVGLGLYHEFTYAAGSNELVKAKLPYGAELEWGYAEGSYLNGQKFREVGSRWLRTAPGAAQWTYTFSPYAPSGAQYVVDGRLLQDASGFEKVWFFQSTDAARFDSTLTTAFEERDGAPTYWRRLRLETTWVQDAGGRPYGGTVVSKVDAWTALEKVSKTETVRDAYGNVTEQRIYDYADLVNPLKTVRTTLDTAMAAQGMYNRVKKVEVISGAVTRELMRYEYDGNGASYCPAGSTTLTDASGMTHHDAGYGVTKTDRGLVTYVKQMGQPGVCASYDIGGNVLKTKEPLTGREMAYSVTSASKWTAPSVATPDQTSQLASSYQFNSFLGLSQETGPNGATASFSYDSLTRPASVTNAHGGVTSYTYFDSNRNVVATLPSGATTLDARDGLGRTVLTAKGDQMGWKAQQLTEYAACACSPVGKVKRVSSSYLIAGGTPAWTDYVYDARGRTVQVTPPGSAGSTSYVYEGNTVKVTEPYTDPLKMRWKKFTLDVLGRLTKVTEPNPAGGADVETFYSYDVLDKLTQVSMTRGGVTQLRTFVYNSQGQLTSMTQPETGTTSYTYDAYGRSLTKTDAKGNVETYAYDSHWRRYGVYRKPAGWTLNDSNQTTLVNYDTAVNGWGRVASVVQGEGRIVESYEYTVGGMVAKKRLGFGSYDTALEAVYSWNQAGQMTAMKYPDVYNADGTVAATGRTLNYAYGYLGAPAAMTDLALPAGLQTVASGVWNGAGQMTQMSVRKADGTMDVESFTYNERGQLLQQSGRGVNIEYRYSLTANDGRLVSRKDNVSGEEVSYQYDLLGRLISAKTTDLAGWGLSWTYDGFGNRLTQGVTQGSGPVVNLTVNAANNRISSSGFIYDDNGNQTQWPVGAGTATASYDALNRMTSVSTSNGTEGYAYSAANQRVLVARAGGTETLFYGLGGELLGIYGRTVKANGRYYVSSVIGTRVWFAGRMIESNGSAVVRDRLGSVEKNGTSLTHYYPYGEEQGGATAGNKEKFATYTRDAVSGLDYAWNRYYSSTWGRFTSADPYVMSGGLGNPQGWNRYSYVENDPVNLSDRTGLQADQCSDPEEAKYIPFCIERRTSARSFIFAAVIPHPEGGLHGVWLNGWVPLPQSGGKNGPSQSDLQNSFNRRMQAQAAEAVRTISEPCRKALGEKTGQIASAAASTTFWDGSLPQVRSLWTWDITGFGDGRPLGQLLAGSDAIVLRALDGLPSSHVVVASSFSGYDSTYQNIVLIHELLHVALRLDDITVAGTLGLGAFADTPEGRTAASVSISEWLRLDCPPVK